jgi:hypothetical protein
MQDIFKQNLIAISKEDRTDNAMGEPIGFFGKLFGCWHKDLSRPFTGKRQSYRVCLECGARKEFDASNLKTFGPFYYPPKVVTVN